VSGQVFGYNYALPLAEVDLDEHRNHAVMACYKAALDAGLHPVEKPRVKIDAGGNPMSYGYIRPLLRVTVRCVP
jgi:hypothetical protein